MTAEVIAFPSQMSAAEFKVARERLGLPLAWVAVHLGVTDKTVSRWETGERSVPADAAAMLAELHRDTNRFVMTVVAGLDDGQDVPALVFTYRLDEHMPVGYSHKGHLFPASWHRALMGRVQLISECDVKIAYADPQDEPPAAP